GSGKSSSRAMASRRQSAGGKPWAASSAVSSPRGSARRPEHAFWLGSGPSDAGGQGQGLSRRRRPPGSRPLDAPGPSGPPEGGGARLRPVGRPAAPRRGAAPSAEDLRREDERPSQPGAARDQ